MLVTISGGDGAVIASTVAEVSDDVRGGRDTLASTLASNAPPPRPPSSTGAADADEVKIAASTPSVRGFPWASV